MSLQLVITKLSKLYDKRDQYSIFDVESKYFSSIKEAKSWIKETYENKKKTAMFKDDIEGNTIGQIGYVIGFRNYDWDDKGKRVNFLEQHWIEFRQNDPIILKEVNN